MTYYNVYLLIDGIETEFYGTFATKERAQVEAKERKSIATAMQRSRKVPCKVIVREA